MPRGVTRSWTTTAATLLLAAGLSGLGGCGLGEDPAVSQQAISDNYRRFVGAVEQRDGGAAADLLTASSIAYYDGLRSAALDEDKAALARRSAIDQLTVLSLRADLPVPVLRSGTPRELVVEGVVRGVISQGSTPQVGLEEIAVDGERATAKLALGGTATAYGVAFNREDEVWKFDVTSLRDASEASLTQIQKSSGMSTQRLVQQVQESRVGPQRAAKLWTAIGRG